MYKAMIVDDEYVVREGIKNYLDWNQHGFESICACSNGQEAIDDIEGGYRPDLIISDICMPFVSGLKFAEYVSGKYGNPIIIIISGYDDFKFAQKAIKLKVYDYILKPVTADGMCKIIDKAKAELDRRKTASKNIVQLENTMSDALPLLKAQFFNLLIKNKIEPKRIESKLLDFDLHFDGGPFNTAVIGIDNIDRVRKNYFNAPAEILHYAIFNIVQEISEEYKICTVFQSEDGRTVLLFQIDGKNLTDALLKEFIFKISSVIKENLDFSVSIGIGRPVASLCALYTSFEDAEYALGFRFFQGNGSIIRRKDIIEPTGTQIDFPYFEKKFFAAMKSCLWENLLACINEFFETLTAKKLTSDRCIYYIRRLMLSIVNEMSDLDIDASLGFLNGAFEQISKIKVETLPELSEYLTDLCRDSLDYILAAKSSGAESIVHRAEQYVKDHYADPTLTLSSIALAFSISVSYFCSIFKNYTGKTFIEFLNQYRLDKAKELLKVTSKNICEIAADVGYTDQHYFSIAFKKSTGVTPKKFRTLNAGIIPKKKRA